MLFPFEIFWNGLWSILERVGAKGSALEPACSNVCFGVLDWSSISESERKIFYNGLVRISKSTFSLESGSEVSTFGYLKIICSLERAARSKYFQLLEVERACSNFKKDGFRLREVQILTFPARFLFSPLTIYVASRSDQS